MIFKSWKTKICQHPFEDSKKVGTVVDKDRINERFTISVDGKCYYYKFVHNVRRCGHCNEYFVDSGFEAE